MEKKLKLYVFAASAVLMLMLIFFAMNPLGLHAFQGGKKKFRKENLKVVLQKYLNKVADKSSSVNEKERFAKKIVARCESDGILVYYRYKGTEVVDTLSLASYLTRLRVLGYRQPKLVNITKEAEKSKVTELRIVEDRQESKSDI
ncbi:hypothetical protein BKI52_19035 [marine bacterium AO1-C]|nr:hypothetical protein BKI52_19035 [marine bacterium AO1-C]